MGFFKVVVSVLTTSVLFTGCSQDIESADVSEARTSVLSVVTSAEPETQLMALILSKAAYDQGNTVRILLCNKGGDLALKAPLQISQEPLAPKNMSPYGLLSKLLETGVQVDVCAIYLPNRDFGKEALLEHVGVATPADIAAYYTENNARVLSF